MAEHIGDLLHRRAGAQEARRRRVPQNMRPRQARIKARACVRAPHSDAIKDAHRERHAARGEHEHRPLSGRGSSASEVVRKGRRDLRRQRQTGCAPGLARPDRECPGAPVDVVERDCGDVASA